MKKTNKFLSLVLSLAMVATSFLQIAVSTNVEASEEVTYLSPTYNTANTPSSGIKSWSTESCTTYTSITEESTELAAGWYVVDSNVTIATRINLTGDVNIILKDGCTLRAQAGITVSSGNSLTIFGQENNTGVLQASCGNNPPAAAIGTVSDGSWNGYSLINGNNLSSGAITINGGTIKASSGLGAAAIGGAPKHTGNNITINGGIVYASGGQQASGIGGGWNGSGAADITINGGVIRAAASWGRGISGGTNIKIGSNVTAITTNSNDVTKIIAHTPGEEMSTKFNLENIELFVHPHDWQSEKVSDSKVVAECKDTSHRHVGDKTISLELTAEDTQFTESPIEATLSGLDKWELQGHKVEDIYYEGVSGTSYAKSKDAPVNCGKYKATVKVTVVDVSGTKDYTLTKEYEITKRTWETLPIPSVKEFNYGKFDDKEDENLPTNDIGIKTDVAYFFNLEESNEDGTAWTKEAVNVLDSGVYYIYAVLTENQNMEGCTTLANAFKINHVHDYGYQKSGTDSVVANCVSADKSCVGDVRTITLKISDAVYSGEEYVPDGVELFEKESAEEVEVTYKDKDGKSLDSAPINVGSYKATLKIPEKTFNGTKEPVSVTADFKITAKPVAKPTVGTDTYTFTGKEQTYKLTDNEDKDLYQFVESTGQRTDAGKQDVKVELKDKDNYTWEDGKTDDLVFTDAFEIEKKVIAKPQPDPYKDIRYYYTAAENTGLYINSKDKDWYQVKGTTNKRTDAGKQNIVFELKDKNNTVWEGETPTSDDFELEDGLVVNPLPIPAPYGDPRYFEADGSEKTYMAFLAVSGYLYNFDGVFYNTVNNKRTAAGTQTVSVTPMSNFSWEDGSTTAKTYTFTVEQPKMNARISCLKDKNGKFTDGYPYGEYLYDTTDTSNEKVSKFYTPNLYNMPKDVKNPRITYYYCTDANKSNPVNWNNLTFKSIPRSDGYYRLCYVYADITSDNYPKYSTPCSYFYVYTPICYTYSYRTYTTKQEVVHESHYKHYRKWKDTQNVKKSVDIRSQSFIDPKLAVASMERNLNNGTDVEVFGMVSTRQEGQYTKSNISKLKSAFNSSSAKKTNYYSEYGIETFSPTSLGQSQSLGLTTVGKGLTLNMNLGDAVENTESGEESLGNELKLSFATSPEQLESFVPPTVDKDLILEMNLGDYIENTEEGEEFLENVDLKPAIDLEDNDLLNDAKTVVDEGDKKTYKVIFDLGYFNFENEDDADGENSILDEKEVEAGNQLKKPEDPTSEGFSFLGWYYFNGNIAGKENIDIEKDGVRWDFEDGVHSDMTLYGLWRQRKSASSTKAVNITVDKKGQKDKTYVQVGSKVSSIEKPTESKKVFAGWYSDEALTKEVSDDTIINSAMTLYPRFKWDSKFTINMIIGSNEASAFGESVINDVAPVIKEERTMLPARFVFEKLGAKVGWDEKTKTVTITSEDGKTVIEIPIGSPIVTVNGEKVTLDSPAFIENSRTYTPVRFIAEALGAEVEWDAKTQEVTIIK